MDIRKLFAVARATWKRAVAGGIVFWAPDVLCHSIRKSELTILAVAVLSLTMPLVVFFAYLAVRLLSRVHSLEPLALPMLCGIWLLGPAMIALGATFAGAGFKSFGGTMAVILATVVPPYLLIMSGLDFTFLALLLVTVLLILLHFRFEKAGTAMSPKVRSVV